MKKGQPGGPPRVIFSDSMVAGGWVAGRWLGLEVIERNGRDFLGSHEMGGKGGHTMWGVAAGRGGGFTAETQGRGGKRGEKMAIWRFGMVWGPARRGDGCPGKGRRRAIGRMVRGEGRPVVSTP
jgi:hypothetical protein